MLHAMSLVSLWVFSSGSGANDFACPADIQVEEHVPAPPSGWTAFSNDAQGRHLRVAVGFYDGPPEERASLKQDSEDETGPAVWTFARTPGRAIWQVCTYSDTPLRLSRPLPDSIQSCRATYESRKRGTVGGLRVLKAVTCQ